MLVYIQSIAITTVLFVNAQFDLDLDLWDIDNETKTDTVVGLSTSL